MTAPKLTKARFTSPAQMIHESIVESDRLDTWRAACPIEDALEVYTCIRCFKLKPWSDGCADDMPDHCSDCWCAAHHLETDAGRAALKDGAK